MRNQLGQEIAIGSHVVVVNQGRGYADLDVGTVEKLSKDGYPQVRYVSNGKLSPPMPRYSRLFVISEREYAEIAEREAIRAEAEKKFEKDNTAPSRPQPIRKNKWGYDEWDNNDLIKWRSDLEIYYKERELYINAALLAAGKDSYYD